MTKVKLTRIESNHDNLRTSVIRGTLLNPVGLGECILLLADPIDWINGPRAICTTEVLDIQGDLHYTKNSIYKIEEIIDEVPKS